MVCASVPAVKGQIPASRTAPRRELDIDGHGRWLSHRVLWLLEVRDGRIVTETVWNDLAAFWRHLL
jgi:ketosteroid isomerase-like protein